MTKEQQIKNYITHRFNNMTYDEYMCCGTGTLSVLDEAIGKYDADCELNDDEVAKLAEYCIKESTEFGKRFAMYQLSQELEDAIASAFNDNDGLGRLEFWINKLYRYAEPRDYERLKNYTQLTASLAISRGLNADELAELEQNYDEWLHERAHLIMDGFAEMCVDINVDYDDQDEWLQWLQGFEYLNWQEMQYINILWDDEAKAKYRRPNVDETRFADDDMPYCTRLAEMCAQRLFKDETIKED